MGGFFRILFVFLIVDCLATHWQGETQWGRRKIARETEQLLRNGIEFTVYLKPQKLRSFYFPVKYPKQPLWIYVTPCGGTVKWRLTQSIPLNSDSTSNFDSPSLAQHQTLDPLILASQEDIERLKKTTLHNSPYFNEILPARPATVAPWKSQWGFSTVEQHPNTIFSLQNSTQLWSWDRAKMQQLHQQAMETNKLLDPQYLRREVTLVQEVGLGRMEYYSADHVPGLLHFYVVSPYASTIVKVFMTSDIERLDEYYPKVPSHSREKRVQLLNVSANGAIVRWDHSPPIDWFQQRQHIHYCLALSTARNYYSYCELLNNNFIPVENPVQKKSNKLYEEPERKYTHRFAENPSDITEKSPYVVCTKFKNAQEFNGLTPNKKYHLSLFAVNVKSGGTTSYDGLSFKTPERNKSKSRTFLLPDNQIQSSYLNPAKAAFKLYKFPVTRFYSKIKVIVQPCSGYIRVNLYKNNKLLERPMVFSQLRRFVIENVTPGMIKIKIVNDDNDAKIFKVWASKRPSKDPYPQLPEDASIQVLDDSRGCREVTLAWLPTMGNVRYCLYSLMEKDDYFKRLILEEFNACLGPSRKATFVNCLDFKLDRQSVKSEASVANPGILHDNIGNLRPGTTYRFDLFATLYEKFNNQTMSYRTIWVKTKEKC